MLPARSTHNVVAGFVDLFFVVFGGDGIFLEILYISVAHFSVDDSSHTTLWGLMLWSLPSPSAVVCCIDFALDRYLALLSTHLSWDGLIWSLSLVDMKPVASVVPWIASCIRCKQSFGFCRHLPPLGLDTYILSIMWLLFSMWCFRRTFLVCRSMSSRSVIDQSGTWKPYEIDGTAQGRI